MQTQFSPVAFPVQAISLMHLNPNRLAGRENRVSLTPEVERLLAGDAVVAIGVSGGKDSDACAIAVSRHLDAIGHAGPRILVHADLGRVEWKDSLPACERLAARLGWELLVVRREAGDMLARWQGRWANNVRRYEDLSCVRLILPWSTPSMRFCTSELKTDIITRALKKRFPTQPIVNVTGVRREESAKRARMPVAEPLAKLQRPGLPGLSWNAIIDWPVQDVLFALDEAGLQIHEAYRVYNAHRVSCVYCIMSAADDLWAASTCADNHDVYRDMVSLEAESTFAFQGSRWLADVAPHLLPDALLRRVAEAKKKAVERQAIEAELPEHLLFTAGWPEAMVTPDEAALLASVRKRVSDLLGLNAACTTPESVSARYTELLLAKVAKESKKNRDVAAVQGCQQSAENALETAC